MRAIVINRCYGGFNLSQAAEELLAKKKGISLDKFRVFDYTRDDEDLVAVVRELGVEVSSGSHSSLKIVEIPEDVRWYINDYDGMETIHEVHRTWY